MKVRTVISATALAVAVALIPSAAQARSLPTLPNLEGAQTVEPSSFWLSDGDLVGASRAGVRWSRWSTSTAAGSALVWHEGPRRLLCFRPHPQYCSYTRLVLVRHARVRASDPDDGVFTRVAILLDHRWLRLRPRP